LGRHTCARADVVGVANCGSLEGCVLGVDGSSIKIQKPTSLDTMNPHACYRRKKFYALNVQVGSDARLRFRIASIEHAGSTHDSLAWSCTAAAKGIAVLPLFPIFSMASACSSSSSASVVAARRPSTELLLLGGGLRPGCAARLLGTTSGTATVGRGLPSRGVELMILTAGASGEVLTLASLLLFARLERNMFSCLRPTAWCR